MRRTSFILTSVLAMATAARAGTPTTAPAPIDSPVAETRALLLRSAERTVDGSAARAQLQREWRSNRAAIYGCLSDPDPKVRELAVKQTGGQLSPRSGPDVLAAARTAVPFLVEMARSRSLPVDTRRLALRSALQVRPDGATAVYRMCSTTADDDDLQGWVVSDVATESVRDGDVTPEQQATLSDALPAVADRLGRLHRAGRSTDLEMRLLERLKPTVAQLHAVPLLADDPAVCRAVERRLWNEVTAGPQRVAALMDLVAVAGPHAVGPVAAVVAGRPNSHGWAADCRPWLDDGNADHKRAAVAILSGIHHRLDDDTVARLKAASPDDPAVRAADGRHLCEEPPAWFADQVRTALTGGPAEAAAATDRLRRAAAADLGVGADPRRWAGGWLDAAVWRKLSDPTQAVPAGRRRPVNLSNVAREALRIGSGVGPVTRLAALRLLRADHGENDALVMAAGPLDPPVAPAAWTPGPTGPITAAPPPPAAAGPNVSAADWLLLAATVAVIAVVAGVGIAYRASEP